VWCFDNRFEMALRKLIKKIGVVHFDPIRIAGGAKSLVGSESEADREFVLEQIQKSVTLHETDTVILMLHSDCGAYGGLQAFDNDAAREAESHRQDLHRAVEFLQSRIPQLKVQGFFLDFEGVWEAVLSQPITKSA
jgi:carbonic anhydrase